MITDSERREVAQKLRAMVSARRYEMPGGRGSLVDIDDLLTELLGRRVYDSEGSLDSFEAMYVADLIDPPIAAAFARNAAASGRPTSCSSVARTAEWRLTMISDEQRREAAKELRKLATPGCIRYAEEFYEELREIVAFDLDGSFDGVANSLADLIDRGECENVYDGSVQDSCDNGFKCSVCGCKVEDEEHYRVSGVWNFCPQCGRTVVKP